MYDQITVTIDTDFYSPLKGLCFVCATVCSPHNTWNFPFSGLFFPNLKSGVSTRGKATFSFPFKKFQCETQHLKELCFGGNQ